MHQRIERFMDVELRTVKKEDRAETIIRKIIRRDIRQEDRRAMRKFLKEKHNAIRGLVAGIAEIVHKKKDLTEKLVKDLEGRMRQQNRDFNARIRAIIQNVWHDQIEEAALNINKAIEVKKEQLNVAKALSENAREIEELERKQIEAEEALKRFLEEFEQNKERYRTETEGGARRATTEVRRIEQQPRLPGM